MSDEHVEKLYVKQLVAEIFCFICLIACIHAV